MANKVKDIMVNILIISAVALFCYGFYYAYFGTDVSYETECVPNYMGGCDF